MASTAPRTLEAATRVAEKYAELDGQIAAINAGRQDSITAINADCDRAANALIEERDGLRESLTIWWGRAGAKLTDGKRKSIEIGGCMIGTRAGRASLAIDGNENAIVEKLKRRKWAEGLLKVVWSLDKVAIRKALGSTYKSQLRSLGFSVREGAEQFFIERTDQAGTLGGE